MKRSGPIPRSSRLKRGTRIKPVSDRKRAELARWARVKTQAVADDPVCAFPGCNEPGTDPHHRKKRGRGGSSTRKNCVLLCHPHHVWVEHNDTAAKAMNLSKNSWEAE